MLLDPGWVLGRVAIALENGNNSYGDERTFTFGWVDARMPVWPRMTTICQW